MGLTARRKTLGNIESKDDCLHLSDPSSQDVLLENLKDRYSRNVVFTNMGSKSCIVVNPRKTLESYSDSTSFQYVDHARDTSPEKTPLPAHIFQLADNAYTRMMREEEDQSIVLCGEAGSGKSESRKLLMRQLCALGTKRPSSTRKSRNSRAEFSPRGQKLTLNILKAETILEAFGHAKTQNSPNASCFSRFTEIQYDSKGRLIGAKTLDYLLDKNRVVGKFHADERNYNIFYYLLAGASDEDKEDWMLTNSQGFPYLNSNKANRSLAIAEDDAIKFNELKDCFRSLGISRYTQSEIFNILVAILHLGAIEFEENNDKKQEPCKIKSREEMECVADLLGVSEQDLETTLLYRSKTVKREMCSEFLGASDAQRQRDALASTLYSLVFSWLLEHINSRLCKDDVANFIGLVDFVGTDPTMKKNGFERLLINTANEQLYDFVMKKMIVEDLEILKQERIVSNALSIHYNDNQSQLGFLLGSPDLGLLPMIDGESARTSGLEEQAAPHESGKDAGQRLLSHLIETYSSHPLFHVVSASGKLGKKKNAQQDPLFTIKHSNGIIEYDTTHFTSSNLDTMSPDFVIMAHGDSKRNIPPSDNEFLREIFSEDVVMPRKHWKDSSVLVAASTAKKPLRTPSISRRRGNKRATKASQPEDSAVLSLSLWASFKQSFEELLHTLKETNPWFVFNMSPNNAAASGTTGGFSYDRFDPNHILMQLSHLGLAEIAEARKACFDYTIALDLEAFLDRFKLVIRPVIGKPDASVSAETRVAQFCEKSGWKQDDFAIASKGKLIFLAEGAYRSLTDENKEILRQLEKDEREANYGDNSLPRRRSEYDNKSLAESEWDSSSEYEGSVHETELQDVNSKRFFKLRAAGNLPPLPIETKAGLKHIDNVDVESPKPKKKKLTKARKRWLCLTWSITWWSWPCFLSWCGGMKRPDIRMAWREKFAICVLIFFACCTLLFFIIAPGYLICPKVEMQTISEVNGKQDINNFWAYGNGRVYQLNSLREDHVKNGYGGVQEFTFANHLGNDISPLFYNYLHWDKYCSGLEKPTKSNGTWDNLLKRPEAGLVNYPHYSIVKGQPKPYIEYMNQYTRARLAWTWDQLASTSSKEKRLVVIYNNVYDVSSYFTASNEPFDPSFKELFTNGLAKDKFDATRLYENIKKQIGQDLASRTMKCMNYMFYVGTVDTRDSAACKLSNYVLLAASLFIVLVIFIKFVSALRFGAGQLPENHDKFVILQMPCYTEGPESLQKGLESLAVMRYDDKRKLLFVICDGMIVGSGNDRPTPRIVLDILGVDPNVDPEPFAFQSLGEGDKQLNYGKVYSGLYEVQGHAVPYIVVVKVGKPSERQKPGNRGKRDSQMILLRFLSRVHFNSPMNPMELEMYHHMKNIIGVNPSFYEYILMVDADTEVHVDALNRMISCMVHDSKIMGLCGETLLSNEKESAITMIQVYEYFISHHLAKAFESLFGSVTCLPGCFSMYRIRTPTKNVPLIVAPGIINDYAENEVDTLHLKNLLHLGEDRYLTTLMMKHFPHMKLTFTPDAQCQTNAPDRWNVLLSQRRRWINSTVHNLFELVGLSQLCGFCCFSMRFIVFLDLFSTMVQPASMLYIGFLFYKLATMDLELANDQDRVPIMTIVLLCGVYGLQVIIFAIRKQWAHIGWMVVYILAMPVFSFYIPLYSFWHMDDFSWGNTRVVVGENGKATHYAADVQPFDPKSIVLKKWSEHESDMTKEKALTPMKSEMNYGFKSKKTPSVYSITMPAMPPMPVMPMPNVYPSSAYTPSHYSYAAPLSAPYNNRISMMSMQRSAGPQTPASASVVPPPFPLANAPNGHTNGRTPHPQPTDEELLAAIKRILATANLMTVTKKNVRDELSALFQVDLSERKSLINSYIEDVLQGRR